MKRGFTLIELLTVIAIIAILAIVVVLTINPAALLQQSRDATRVSDTGTINKAVSLYYQDAMANPSTLFMGTSSIVYVSVPDPTATSTAGDQCQGLSLPALPTGYTYQCAATSTYMKTNGTGWIPINFASYSAGSVISKLPVDPINTTSTNLYYTYETDGIGGFKVAAFFESQKYASQMASDGGNDPELYEKGSNLALASGRGLVGYWPMNEGTGSSTIDYSGSNATGTWNGSTTAGSYYATGKVGPYAGIFNGATTYVSIPYSANLNSSNFTVSAWVNITAYNTKSVYYPVGTCGAGACTAANGWGLGVNGTFGSGVGTGCVEGDIYLASFPAGGAVCTLSNTIPTNTWSLITATYNAGSVILYINGVQKGSGVLTITKNTSLAETIGVSNAWYFPGSIDDIRFYGRALSAAEVQEMYNAEH
jgi:prepilin-type N-terminal cleavage/methylation domain-containing protein